MTWLRRWLPWGGLLLAVIVAAVLRYPGLETIPPGLSFDEAGNGVAAMDVAHGVYRVWWPIGGGAEPLMAYLAQPLLWLFGATSQAIRLYAATMGIVTVAGTYWLASELFSKLRDSHLQPRNSDPVPRSWLPLLAALGLATAFWHVAFSRIAFRALAMPAVEVLGLAWLWRALRSAEPLEGGARPAILAYFPPAGRDRRGLGAGWYHFAGAGFFIGLGPYTYPPGRFVPVALLLFFAGEALLAWYHGQRPLLVRHFRDLALATGVALLVFSPLALFFAQHPEAFTERAAAASLFNPQWNQGDLWGTLGRTTLATLGTFSALTGDPNVIANFPGRPMLGAVLAVFFWLGMLAAIWRVVSSLTLGRDPTRNLSAVSQGDAHSPTPYASLRVPTPYLFLLCLWSVMLLPAILAPEGAPHHLRLIGTAPATYILVALGLIEVVSLTPRITYYVLRIAYYASRIMHYTPPISTGSAQSPNASILRWAHYLLPLLFLPIGLVTARDYFLGWTKQPELYMAYDVYAVELAEHMAKENDSSAAYVIPMDLRAGHEARHYTLDFLYRGATPYYYLPVDETTLASRLTDMAAGRDVFRIVMWLQDKHTAADEREVVAFLLRRAARLVREETYPVYRIETWALPTTHPTFSLPKIQTDVSATFGDVLRLDAADVSVGPATEGSTPTGKTVAVALRWAPLTAMDADYKASLRLVAGDGSIAAQKDRFLRHNWHQGTHLWPPETVNEYYLLPPVPPGQYDLRVVVYHPETLAPLVTQSGPEASLGAVEVE